MAALLGTAGVLAIWAALYWYHELEGLVLGWVTWLALFAVLHLWLGYGWQLRALAWQAAYDRDMSLCQQLHSQPLQSQQLSPKTSPKTDFCDQERAVLSPFVQAQRVLHFRDDVSRDAPERSSRNTSIDAYASSDGVLRRSSQPTFFPRTLLSPHGSIRSEGGYKSHTEAGPTPPYFI